MGVSHHRGWSERQRDSGGGRALSADPVNAECLDFAYAGDRGADVVDFKKLAKGSTEEKITDPIRLYDKSDRETDTGPLRKAQEGILIEWRDKRRAERDLILKLHTGQGKTVIGLLICQTQINSSKGPSLYLCPNKYLVAQTCRQAQRFGIKCTTADAELPAEFLDGKVILVTTVQKLFNGRTRFGLGAESIKIGTLVIDDAHACVDAIRDAFTITVESDQFAYAALRDLFEKDLELQGAGTFADLKAGDASALLSVPYWAWREKQSEVVAILAKQQTSKSIKFTWPILRDRLEECACFISGKKLEITPYLPPLEEFGTYTKAGNRIFMSATTANDSFLVRGLGLPTEVVRNPLLYNKEPWLGEKMILIPSLIDESLDRSEIVNWIGKPVKRTFGTVVLTPSFARCTDWKAVGARVVDTDDIATVVDDLKSGKTEETVVLANRYDGIDLPDRACQLLVLDSKPFAESLSDRHTARCIEASEGIAAATARKIEQGLGRSVRGERDFSVILLIGPDLVASVRTPDARRFLSAQTQRQIEIGLEVTRVAKDEKRSQGPAPKEALKTLINQCLGRDEGWKGYYEGEMKAMGDSASNLLALDTFRRERDAELKYQAGDIDGAVKIADELGNASLDDSERGWYLQEKARYEFARAKTESERLQVAAHKRNRRLLKPRVGMDFKRISVLGQRRAERVKEWIGLSADAAELLIRTSALMDAIRFGVSSERFESAWNELGIAMGFAAERPDKDWGEGPDNLWALRDNEYLLAEHKSEVELTRAEIHKDESQQMNNSSVWFAKNYGASPVTRLLVHPATKLARSAAFSESVEIVTEPRLEKLTKNVRAFFREFANDDIKNLSTQQIDRLLAAHELRVEDLIAKYSVKPFAQRAPRI
jgi:replicative superfamily II helicase